MERSSDFMKTAPFPLLTLILLLALAMPAHAQPSAGGVVYGPKGAFNITAPEGWVLDPTGGTEQGLPCVLYPKGATWENADPIMYAKIAATNFEDYQKFAAFAVADMKEKRPGIKPKRIESGKTDSGLPYIINDYPMTKAYGRHERVAYVQLPKAVAYIVFSADEESAFRKHEAALKQAVKSLLSMEVDYPGKPKKAE
jgi:hypothetical protein